MSSHTLDVTVPVSRPEVAQAVAQALNVEVADAPPGTTVRIEARERELHLRFEAEQTRGLRAAVHSYLRWAATAITIAERVK